MLGAQNSGMVKIVFATGNKGKLREAAEILGEGFELLCPADLGIFEDIEETGDTLTENSIIKAKYIYEKTGLNCFADDTGLEVDALDGAPGVHSARYAVEVALRNGDTGLASRADHDFSANINALLSELAKKPGADRKARFRSVVTLIWNGEMHFFEGSFEGRIAESRSGTNGFGYDPVFVPDDCPDRTVAELPESFKNEHSHRAKALKEMAAWLSEAQASAQI